VVGYQPQLDGTRVEYWNWHGQGFRDGIVVDDLVKKPVSKESMAGGREHLARIYEFDDVMNHDDQVNEWRMVDDEMLQTRVLALN
jgi:hypothetical protein